MGALKMGTRELHGERGREQKREKGGNGKFLRRLESHCTCGAPGESHWSKLHLRRGAIATSPAFSNPPLPCRREDRVLPDISRYYLLLLLNN